MSGTNPNTIVLKRAAAWSYIVAAWCFIGAILGITLIILALAPFVSMLSDIASGTYTPTVSDVSAILNAIVLPISAILVITIPMMIFFGYHEYKVGGICNVGSLKVAGATAIFASIAIAPLVYGLYALLAYPMDLEAVSGIPVSVIALLIGGGLFGLFLLISLISFIAGLSGMKRATGIKEFGTAMWLAIAGVLATFLSGVGLFLIPVSIILFGSGLNKLARQGVERKAGGAPGVEEGLRATGERQPVYCPYCGAKVEADALFCTVCGSGLRREV